MIPTRKEFARAEAEAKKEAAKARAPHKDGLVSSAAAAEALGITGAQFRRIVTARAIPPDGTYVNPNYRSGPPAHLWSKKTIGRLKRTNDVRDAKARAAHPRVKKDWWAIWRGYYVKTYGAPADAIPDAAEALFALNRYSRKLPRDSDRLEEIRSLKAQFVTLLYRFERYTDRVVRLERTLDAKICFECDGSGASLYGDDDEDGRCEKCGGTGDYLPKKTAISYAFHFTVGDQHYSWIEPDFAISFVPRVESTEKDTGPRALDTDTDLASKDVVEAMALLHYALETAVPTKEEIDLVEEPEAPSATSSLH